jgi:WD40 repeat protein
LNLSFSPDGELLASTHANGDVRIWPRSSEGGDFLVGRQDGLLNAVEFSPDGRQIASANSAGVARIWDIESRVEVFKLAGQLDDHPMLSLDYLNDPVDSNHRLVTAQGDIVQIWRPDWPALIAYLSGITRACLSVAEREIYLTEDRKDARRKAQGCKLVDAAD